uniref:Elastin microfibril interfacer 3 n=1 Tax=Salmo trutta TaxID=8032 RepID=A0A673Y6S9_SALTR
MSIYTYGGLRPLPPVSHLCYFQEGNVGGGYANNARGCSLLGSNSGPFSSQWTVLTLTENHCAYVVEKTVSFTMQDGVAPYVKAQYNKCAWGQKCPTLIYHVMYKPVYKVAHKTLTELEWRCCPGYSGYGCMEGLPAYQHPIKAMPPFKGPPFKGPPIKGNPWSQTKGPPPMKSYPMLTKELEPSTERLDRMEEDVRRLSQGLETLRGTVNGLEDAPSPVPAPALSSSPHSTVGFADIPGGDPDAEGLDGGQAFPGLSELTGRVEELRTELQAKAAELEELRGSVIRHDGTLKKMSGSADSLTRAEARDTQKAMEDLVDAKLGGARTEILGEFEKRVESAESRCGERARELSRQCHREQQERQDLMELALEVSATGLRKELGYLQTQIQGHDLTEGCCGRVTGLGESVHLLEQLVAGLNQSQGHLRVELGGHKDHVEAMLEGRLEYAEAKLNLTECGKVRGGSASSSEGEVGTGSLEARLEGKLKALEGRLLTALEDLENATAPALLEGHAVPTLETEVESLRRRLEVDVDRVQKQLSGLELLCTSSSQPILQGDQVTSNTHRVEEDKTGGEEEKGLLDMQNNRLNSLNVTLQSLLTRLSHREDHQEGEEESSVKGEIMLLKFNARSMNLTLKGLKDSVGLVVQDVGRANTTWQEREERLAQQVKGVVQLLGRQASMLGVGEKRLTWMKGELQELRRRLAGEVQGCRSTALGVQKEVVEVGGRVASVEGQCKGFSHLAKDLERIRAELERQSDGYLSQVNGTLTNHAHQLSELRQELRNCTWNAEPTQQSLYLLEPEQLREDQ